MDPVFVGDQGRLAGGVRQPRRRRLVVRLLGRKSAHTEILQGVIDSIQSAHGLEYVPVYPDRDGEAATDARAPRLVAHAPLPLQRRILGE